MPCFRGHSVHATHVVCSHSPQVTDDVKNAQTADRTGASHPSTDPGTIVTARHCTRLTLQYTHMVLTLVQPQFTPTTNPTSCVTLRRMCESMAGTRRVRTISVYCSIQCNVLAFSSSFNSSLMHARQQQAACLPNALDGSKVMRMISKCSKLP